MASFHQAVAQGAQGVGLAGAGQSKRQDVHAPIDKTTLGQMVKLLAQRQGHPVALEGLPEGSLDSPAQPVDAPVVAIIGFLFQHI